MSPYIPQAGRAFYDGYIQEIVGAWEDCTCSPEGDMAYIITMILEPFWGGGKWSGKMDAIKVLEGVKLEIYDKIIRPHEKKARKENGDVFK